MTMRFGGPWTELKLDAVQYYMECYTKALRHVGFDLWYIDAFAGTGSRQTERIIGGGLFDGPEEILQETLDGSARRALAVSPGFHHHVFIEMDKERCSMLDAVRMEHPSRDIQVINGEANAVLRRMVEHAPWPPGSPSGKSRGVVFLDPFALHVDWETLRALSSKQVFDVWYLFPIRDTIRQLARSFDGIGPKEPMLDRLLGPRWRELYAIKPEVAIADSLFEVEPTDPELVRMVSVRQFEQWLKTRLEDEFSFVSEPLPLWTAPTRQGYSLFLAVSNPSKPARDLAEKFVSYVNRKYGAGASRRRSGR